MKEDGNIVYNTSKDFYSYSIYSCNSDDLKENYYFYNYNIQDEFFKNVKYNDVGEDYFYKDYYIGKFCKSMKSMKQKINEKKIEIDTKKNRSVFFEIVKNLLMIMLMLLLYVFYQKIQTMNKHNNHHNMK